MWGFFVGCYQPPDFPLIETIPIEAAPGSSCLDRDEYVVACVVDGDTIDLTACGDEEGIRIRMLGIDAPETAKGDIPAECLADEAAAELSERLLGERVRLTFDVACTDVYDRVLAYVWLEDDALDAMAAEPGVDELLDELSAGADEPSLLLNEWLLYTGVVWPFDEDWVAPLIYQTRMDAAVAHAEAGASGVWGECEPGGGSLARVSGDGVAGYRDHQRGVP